MLAPGVRGRWGSAGSVLRSQGSSGKDEAFALLREEKGLIASNARSGPNPLPLGDLEPVPWGRLSLSGVVWGGGLWGWRQGCVGGGGLRGIGPALAGKLGVG